jgi:hypothetical protein
VIVNKRYLFSYGLSINLKRNLKRKVKTKGKEKDSRNKIGVMLEPLQHKNTWRLLREDNKEDSKER